MLLKEGIFDEPKKFRGWEFEELKSFEKLEFGNYLQTGVWENIFLKSKMKKWKEWHMAQR